MIGNEEDSSIGETKALEMCERAVTSSRPNIMSATTPVVPLPEGHYQVLEEHHTKVIPGAARR